MLLKFKLDGNLFGYIMGLFSGVFAGLTVDFIKRLREIDGPVAIYFYFCMLGTLVSLPANIADPRIPASGVDWLMACGIAASSVLAQLLMNQGFRYRNIWLVSIIKECRFNIYGRIDLLPLFMPSLPPFLHSRRLTKIMAAKKTM